MTIANHTLHKLSRSDTDKIYDAVNAIYGERNVNLVQVENYNPISDIVYLKVCFISAGYVTCTMPLNDPYDVCEKDDTSPGESKWWYMHQSTRRVGYFNNAEKRSRAEAEGWTTVGEMYAMYYLNDLPGWKYCTDPSELNYLDPEKTHA